MQEHLPTLFAHFMDQGFTVEMYASDWIFALYSNVIPNEQMCFFFDKFFEHGWCFFYKITLTLLRVL